jgi:hypothetical protein
MNSRNPDYIHFGFSTVANPANAAARYERPGLRDHRPPAQKVTGT